MRSMTYGVLPSEEEFREAFDHVVTNPRGFRFGNDQRVGTCALSATELWREIQEAKLEMEESLGWESDRASNWLTCVLDVLGFEWI